MVIEHFNKNKTDGVAATPEHPISSNETLSRQISVDVAQELNNILMVIRGFTDRMLAKHGADVQLRPDLQLIAENASRAERVVQSAVKINVGSPPTTA